MKWLHRRKYLHLPNETKPLASGIPSLAHAHKKEIQNELWMNFHGNMQWFRTGDNTPNESGEQTSA